MMTFQPPNYLLYGFLICCNYGIEIKKAPPIFGERFPNYVLLPVHHRLELESG